MLPPHCETVSVGTTADLRQFVLVGSAVASCQADSAPDPMDCAASNPLRSCTNTAPSRVVQKRGVNVIGMSGEVGIRSLVKWRSRWRGRDQVSDRAPSRGKTSPRRRACRLVQRALGVSNACARTQSFTEAYPFRRVARGRHSCGAPSDRARRAVARSTPRSPGPDAA